MKININEKEDKLKIIRKPSETTQIEASSILSFKGNRFEISGKINTNLGAKKQIKSFYLENSDTLEKIFFNNFTVDYSVNSFNLVMDLSEHPLYEGRWTLYSLLSINEVDDHVVGITHCNSETKLQGDYLEYNNSLYYYELYKTKKAQVSVLIKKDKHPFAFLDIREILLENNLLSIQGFFQFKLMSSKEDRVNKIVLINRGTKEEIGFPIEIANEAFMCKIPFDDHCNIIMENGIWDAFASLKISGVNKLIRINMNTNQINEESINFSKPIYNSKFVRNIRSYVTVGNNLAFQVTDDLVTCDVTRVDLENGKTMVNGFIVIKDLDFNLKNIHLQNINGQEKIACSNEFKEEQNQFYFKTMIDWAALNSNEILGTNYQFIITIVIGDNEYLLELVSNFDDIPNKSRIVIYPPLIASSNGYPLEVRHYYNRKNALLVSIGNALNAFCVDLKKIGKDMKLEISAEIEQESVKSNDVELVLMERNTERVIKLPPEKIGTNNRYLFNINESLLKSSNISQSNYEVFLALYINNQMVMARVSGMDSDLIEGNSTFKTKAVKMNEGLFFSLFFDRRNKNLNFEIRELRANEKTGEKFKFFLARGLAKVTKRFFKKPVWVIGENLGEIAQDNGFAFFQYCIENKNSEKYYYVSKKDNKDAENLIPYQANILLYDSFKHYFIYWLCQYLIISHGIRDAIPSIVHNKMNSNPKKIIYLQHGIIAMKKLKFNKDSYNGMIKRFVVSSVHEKNILIEKMNFKAQQIMVTGLARFDTLMDKSEAKEIKEILLMPTWREWIIDSETDFLSSDFYNHYIDFLRDKNLHEILEKHNIILKFFPHIEIQKKYKDYFSSLNERIKIVQLGEQSVKDLIQESSLLITDYSSVVFDFNYIRKPIVFFQFDLNEYVKRRGSYVDLRNELIGDVAYTKEDLIRYITQYIKADFKYKPIYLVKSKKYYAFRDQENSNRIYNGIKKLSKK